MYLYIKGFRTIQQYECEFQSEAITLVSGPSGIGKTTIMNAVYWCLYGNLKNVRKFGTKTGTCLVKLELYNIRIIRSKSPESLLFEDIQTSTVLKDDEAQEKIIQLFGSSNIWLSSCYLRQGTRNKFLESSPSERLELLSELCFSSQSPETYIEKIDDKLKHLTKEFERQNDFYKRDLEVFQKRRKEYPKYRDDILTLQQKEVYQQQIQSNDIHNLEVELSQAERMESSYQSLMETRNQLKSRFPNYKDYLLSQEKKNKLIQITSEDKSTLSPHRTLNHLQIEIQNLESKKVLLQAYREQFTNKLSQSPELQRDTYRNHILSQDSLNEYHDKIKELPIQIESHEKILRESERQKNNHINWTQQLEALEKELNTLQPISIMDEHIDRLSRKIQSTKSILETKKRRDEWIEKLESFQDVLNNDEIQPRQISIEEMNEAIFMEKKISERKELLHSLSIEDEKEIVKKAIDVRKRICDIQHLWTYVSELQDLEMRVNEYEEKIEKLGRRKEWISEEDIPKKILELNSLRETLTCPKCSVSLRFESNHLVECHTNISKDKLDSMNKWIDDSKKRIEWMQWKSKLDDEMNLKMTIFETNCQKMNLTQEQLYEYPKLEDMERQKLFLEVVELERFLSTYDHSLSSSESLQLSQRKWEASLIEKEMNQLSNEPSECNDNLEDLEHEREKWIVERSRYQYLTPMIDSLREKISMCKWDDCVSMERIQSMKDKIQEAQTAIQNHLRTKEIFALEEKIEELNAQEIDNLIETKKSILEEKWVKIEKERDEWENARETLQMCEKAETIHNLDHKMSLIVIEDPNKIKEKICMMRERVEDMKTSLQKSERAEELMNEKSRLEKQRLDVIEESNKVSSMSVIKSIANELAHKRMISILDTINDFSNEVLSILFDEPIKIEFMVYKTSKTKEKIKPSIVYKLLYRGYEMDHVDQLSGGEGDRVSLAITCALFQFSKFPFLLLDEFASSLDLNTKEVAIKSLKTFLGIGGGDSKSVLCISHDTVEGIYDYIMKL